VTSALVVTGRVCVCRQAVQYTVQYSAVRAKLAARQTAAAVKDDLSCSASVLAVDAIDPWTADHTRRRVTSRLCTKIRRRRPVSAHSRHTCNRTDPQTDGRTENHCNHARTSLLPTLYSVCDLSVYLS